MTAKLVAGGNGANCRITAAGKDDEPVAELIAADSEAVIAAGQKGSRPGRLTLYNGTQHATVNITSSNGHVVAGGNGVNGRFSTCGKDGRPIVEMIASDTEAIIGLGQLNRPGRISLYDAAQHESIRIDAEKGDIVFENADCAEEFEVAGDAEPGDVVVLDDDGCVRQCTAAYDWRVMGVISGAGIYRPEIVLGRRDRQSTRGRSAPVALLGKVYCRVDAQERPIRAGDLLTTASLPGHAMRAADRRRVSGALLGKALRPLLSGTGVIPILVTLR
jgi:hypothetical protein